MKKMLLAATALCATASLGLHTEGYAQRKGASVQKNGSAGQAESHIWSLFDSWSKGELGATYLAPNMLSVIEDQREQITRDMRSFGRIVTDPQFLGEKSGSQLFSVQHENYIVSWRLTLASSGKVAGLWYQHLNASNVTHSAASAPRTGAESSARAGGDTQLERALHQRKRANLGTILLAPQSSISFDNYTTGKQYVQFYTCGAKIEAGPSKAGRIKVQAVGVDPMLEFNFKSGSDPSFGASPTREEDIGLPVHIVVTDVPPSEETRKLYAPVICRPPVKLSEDQVKKLWGWKAEYVGTGVMLPGDFGLRVYKWLRYGEVMAFERRGIGDSYIQKGQTWYYAVDPVTGVLYSLGEKSGRITPGASPPQSLAFLTPEQERQTVAEAEAIRRAKKQAKRGSGGGISLLDAVNTVARVYNESQSGGSSAIGAAGGAYDSFLAHNAELDRIRNQGEAARAQMVRDAQAAKNGQQQTVGQQESQAPPRRGFSSSYASNSTTAGTAPAEDECARNSRGPNGESYAACGRPSYWVCQARMQSNRRHYPNTGPRVPGYFSQVGAAPYSVRQEDDIRRAWLTFLQTTYGVTEPTYGIGCWYDTTSAASAEARKTPASANEYLETVNWTPTD